MKKIYLILLFIQAVAYAQTSGNVLMNSDGTARLPDNSITIGKVVGLQDAINGKQATLVSGTNIKTVNGNNILGSGDISISSAVAWGGVTGTLSNQSDLNTALGGKEPTISAGITAQYWRGDKTWQTLNSSAVGLGNVTNESKATMFTNPAFTGTTTGITATMVGLGNVTNESKATMFTNAVFTGTFNVADGSIANADLANAAVANLSGTNTGDNATNTQYSGLAASKQDLLVSNTNIKTVNGNSLLGSGNISISGAPTFLNLANAFSSTSVTQAAVTGWSFAVTSGVTYRIEIISVYQTAATTTGGEMGLFLSNSGAGTVRGFMQADIVSTAAATGLKIPITAVGAADAAGSFLISTGVTAANAPHSFYCIVTFTCTVSGTMNVGWATEVAASAAQLNQNSSLIYQALN